MRALLVLLPCAACNNLLGLGETTERPIDAPPVPFACLPLPTFTTTPMKLFDGLSDYTADLHGDTREAAWSVAAMTVQDDTPGHVPFSDASFSDSASYKNAAPRLSPSGEQLFVRSSSQLAQVTLFKYYVRGEGMWTNPTTMVFGSNAVVIAGSEVLSTPSQNEAQRRILVTQIASGKSFVELSDEGSMWKTTATYTPDAFKLADFSDPYLSPDALAMAFVGTHDGVLDVYIVVRDAITVAFDPTRAVVLYHPSNGVTVATPFLNRDCSRLYFARNDGVYYTTP